MVILKGREQNGLALGGKSLYWVSQLHLIGAVIYLLLALFIFTRNSRALFNQIGFFTFYCFFLWSLGASQIHHPVTTLQQAEFWLFIFTCGGVTFPALLFSLATGITRIKVPKLVFVILFLCPLLLVVGQLQGENLVRIDSVRKEDYGWFLQFTNNWLYTLYAVYSTATIFSTSLILFLAKRNTSLPSGERQKASTLFWGLIIVYITVGMVHYLLTILNLSASLITDLFFLPLAFGVFWAIEKHKLFAPAPENSFREVFDALNEAVFMLRADGSISYWNQAAEKLYAANPVKGKAVDFSKLEEGLFRNAMGKTLQVVAESTVLKDESGIVSGKIWLVRDISETFLMQEERSRVRRLESLELFAGSVAHDLNNMLSSLAVYINLSQENLTTALGKQPKISHAIDECRQGLEFLEKAEDVIPEISGLTRKLMLFSRRNEEKLEKEVASIYRLCVKAVELVSAGKNPQILIDADYQVDFVLIDESQILQVITNLLLNALQAAGDNGHIRIAITRQQIGEKNPRLLQTGSYICIEILDSGPGIPEEILPYVFDPFFTTKEDGTGLGLASCQSIIHRHKGWIGAHNAPKGGACFTIYLPENTVSIQSPQMNS